jgi:DNA polymerase (family 10)
MENSDVVALLEEIAILLELSGENPFKARAYENVARRIEHLEESVEDLAKEGRLREIQGVGDALEEKITEYVKTGRLRYHDELRKKFPDSLFDLFRIPGLGPKRIKQLYEDLKIASISDLEAAARGGRLEALSGFGKKMEEKILQGIQFSQQQEGRHLFHEAFAEAQRIKDFLSAEKAVSRVEIAGSLRRRKELIGDIDILASSGSSKALMDRFVKDAHVARVTGHGETKSSVVLKSGIAADLRVVSDAEFPYALVYFTGSKAHNVVLRQRAKDLGLKLNEYGLLKGEKNVPCKTEADIYKKLGLPYIPPEMREDMGEFDTKKMPVLVTLEDVIGLFHCHSKYSDGHDTIAEMAEAAQEAGYQYMTMTDHSQSATIANGLKADRVEQQQAEIDKLNKKLKGFHVLKGIESDIRKDGKLDYPEAVLKTFDLVIASVHSGLDMHEADATRRVVKAIENPYTTILGHPTGRLLLTRKGLPLNYEKVFDACIANRVAVEINANCHRLDLDWRHLHRAKDRGVMLVIGPDAHSIEGIGDTEYGIGIARKGWLEAKDLLNCLTLAGFRKWQKG